MKCMLKRGSGSRLDYPVPHNSASIRHERLPRNRKAMVGSYLEGTGFSHVIFNCISQLYLCNDGASTIYFGDYTACSGGTGHDS